MGYYPTVNEHHMPLAEKLKMYQIQHDRYEAVLRELLEKISKSVFAKMENDVSVLTECSDGLLFQMKTFIRHNMPIVECYKDVGNVHPGYPFWNYKKLNYFELVDLTFGDESLYFIYVGLRTMLKKLSLDREVAWLRLGVKKYKSERGL